MQPDARAARNRVSVWIVEDNLEYRESVRALLESSPDLISIRAFESGEELTAFLADHFAPDVMLVDLGLPTMSGIEVIGHLHKLAPHTQTVVLTIHEDSDRIFQAICAGASGYLLKTATPQDILQAIRDVRSGGAPLTKEIARRVLNLFAQHSAPRRDYDLSDRELEVLEHLVDGKTKPQIAKVLFLSVHTVDSHFRSIYDKLHVHSRSGAVAVAIQDGIVRR